MNRTYFHLTLTFIGSQEEIVEQMELMKEYIASRAPYELKDIDRKDIIIKELPQPKPKEDDTNHRVITAQDNTRTDYPHLRGEEQPDSRRRGRT